MAVKFDPVHAVTDNPIRVTLINDFESFRDSLDRGDFTISRA
jgi:hypothetical protein